MLQHVNVCAVIFEKCVSFANREKQRDKKCDMWGVGLPVSERYAEMISAAVQSEPSLSFYCRKEIPVCFCSTSQHPTSTFWSQVSVLLVKAWSRSLDQMARVSPYLLCVNRIHSEVLLQIWCTWSQDARCSITEMGCFSVCEEAWGELKCEVTLYSFSFCIFLSSRVTVCDQTAVMALWTKMQEKLYFTEEIDSSAAKSRRRSQKKKVFVKHFY